MCICNIFILFLPQSKCCLFFFGCQCSKGIWSFCTHFEELGRPRESYLYSWSRRHREPVLQPTKCFRVPQCSRHASENERMLHLSPAYTSKTCGRCGNLHNKLGENKLFQCSSCDVTLDRDANGARNILLRYLARAGNGIVA